MKRWALRITICLLLGAIVNVAVAWGIMLSHGPSSKFAFTLDFTREREFTPAEAEWLCAAQDEFPTTIAPFRVTRVRYASAYDQPRCSGWSHTAYAIDFMTAGSNAPKTHLFAHSIECGWPLRCMAGRSTDLNPGWTPLWAPQEEFIALTTPISFGFMANSLAYAVILLVMLRGWVAFRRVVRKRRGACVHCGYALRGTAHAACPECGTEPEAEARR